MGRRKRRHGKRTIKPPAAAVVPDYRRVWVWISVLAIPGLIAIVSALYAARLSLGQAGEQEAAAQSGANASVDAELGRGSALLARVRIMRDVNHVWVFPQALDDQTRSRLVEADLNGPITDESDQPKRDQGGYLGFSGYYGDQFKPMSRHLISLVGNRREKVRVIDVKARVLEKLPAFKGTLLVYQQEGGSPVERVGIDLDHPDGQLMITDENTLSIRPYLDSRSVTFDKGEEIGFEVSAFAEVDSLYRWEFEVTVAYGNIPSEKLVIRSDGTPTGKPFETMGWTESCQYPGGVHRAALALGKMIKNEC